MGLPWLKVVRGGAGMSTSRQTHSLVDVFRTVELREEGEREGGGRRGRGGRGGGGGGGER